MAKSIKLKNNTYLDASGVVYRQKGLNKYLSEACYCYTLMNGYATSITINNVNNSTLMCLIAISGTVGSYCGLYAYRTYNQGTTARARVKELMEVENTGITYEIQDRALIFHLRADQQTKVHLIPIIGEYSGIEISINVS